MLVTGLLEHRCSPPARGDGGGSLAAVATPRLARPGPLFRPWYPRKQPQLTDDGQS